MMHVKKKVLLVLDVTTYKLLPMKIEGTNISSKKIISLAKARTYQEKAGEVASSFD